MGQEEPLEGWGELLRAATSQANPARGSSFSWVGGDCSAPALLDLLAGQGSLWD